MEEVEPAHVVPISSSLQTEKTNSKITLPINRPQTAVARSIIPSTSAPDILNVGSAYSVTQLKDSRLPLSPTCTNAYPQSATARSIVSSISVPNILNVGSAYSVTLLKDSRLPLSPTCPNSYVQTTMAKSTMEPTAMKMTSFDLGPESVPVSHDLSPSCQGLVLPPEFVTDSPPAPNLGSIYLAPHNSDITLPRHFTDLIMQSETAASFSTPVALGLSSIRLVADPTISMSPTCTDPNFRVNVPASTLTQPSPPVELTIPESTRNGSRIEAIQAKVAIQVKIYKESKTRAKKAAKALRNVWKHDSKYRRWIKVRKQAAKTLQVTGDKIKEIRREEEKIRANIERMESTS